jgi:hypothetical protein
MRLILVFFLLAYSLSSFAQTSKEEEAIKNVIAKENQAWKERNYDVWASCFVQKPYTHITQIRSDITRSLTYDGWKS